jgi:Flp pilus assembly protein TadB
MHRESQPPDRRGTVGHPYSALNLRLVLAAFGVVICAIPAAFLLWAGRPILAVILAVLAVVALVDLMVVQSRRRARRRADDGSHSLFE